MESSPYFTDRQKAAILVILRNIAKLEGESSNPFMSVSDYIKQKEKERKEFLIFALAKNLKFDIDSARGFTLFNEIHNLDFDEVIHIIKPLTQEQYEFILSWACLLIDSDYVINKAGKDMFDELCVKLGINNNHIESELEKHMQSFDNLGFNNQRVYNWHKSILEALQNDGYTMSDFYFTSNNLNNNELLQHVALMENSYNFLNSKGLINRGFCPITGEAINNTFNFNIFGRVVYLSKTGLETCENIKRKDWNKSNPKIDYDTFQNRKRQVMGNTNPEEQGKTSLSGWIIFIIFWIVVILLLLKHC